MKKSKLVIPKKLGAIIDRMYEIREEKAKVSRVEAALDADYKELQKHVLEKFKKTELEGARGTMAMLNTTPDIVPTVKDWDMVYAWVLQPVMQSLIKKRKVTSEDVEACKLRCSIFQRRLSTELWKQMLDAKTPVLGTEAFPITKVSLTAVKAKGK